MNNSINSKPIISIDLRQSSLIKIPSIGSTEYTSDIFSNKNQNNITRTTSEENSNNVSLPSTIIHLKFINSDNSDTIKNNVNFSESLDIQLLNSNPTLSATIPVSLSINENNYMNKANSLISDMRREIKANMTIGLTNKKDSNLERFEIQRYLERIKNDKQPLVEDSKTKYKKRKYSKYNKDYSFESLKDQVDISTKKVKYSKLNSSKDCYLIETSEISDSHFRESKNEKSNLKELNEKCLNSNKVIPMLFSHSKINSLKNKPSKRIISCPASYKRKKYKLIGPNSILKKLFEKYGISSLNESRLDSERLMLGFKVPSFQSFYQGYRMSLIDGSIKNGEETLFIMVPHYSKDHLDKISEEQLIIWKLNEDEIIEMIDQIRRESVHQKGQRIMPEILGMSYEQIEFNYKGATDVMKNYDIEPIDEENDESSVENDVCLINEKYSEENQEVYDSSSRFTQPAYKKLNDIREKVQLCLQNAESFFEEGTFEAEDSQEDQIKTEYSMHRPKRSSVNYTSTAYAAIRAQEGGRLSSQPQKYDTKKKKVPTATLR